MSKFLLRLPDQITQITLLKRTVTRAGGATITACTRPNRNMRAYTPGHKELKRHDKSPDPWGSLMATGTGDYGLDRKGHDQILTQVTKFIGEAEFS